MQLLGFFNGLSEIKIILKTPGPLITKTEAFLSVPKIRASGFGHFYFAKDLTDRVRWEDSGGAACVHGKGEGGGACAARGRAFRRLFHPVQTLPHVHDSWIYVPEIP